MQDSFARARAQPLGQARATIGYLVYKNRDRKSNLSGKFNFTHILKILRPELLKNVQDLGFPKGQFFELRYKIWAILFTFSSFFVLILIAKSCIQRITTFCN